MKHFLVGLLAGFGAIVAGQAHAAEGLVCTSVIRSDVTSGEVVPLHNGSRFNCGAQIQSKTIPEISAAGWMIVHVQPGFIAPGQVVWQFVIQR